MAGGDRIPADLEPADAQLGEAAPAQEHSPRSDRAGGATCRSAADRALAHARGDFDRLSAADTGRVDQLYAGQAAAGNACSGTGARSGPLKAGRRITAPAGWTLVS